MRKRGFTLIEIMVVVGIIGLLSAVASVSFAKQRTNSRNARRVTDMKSIQTALDLYANDNTNKYPTSANSNNKYSGDPSNFRANRPGGTGAPNGAYIPDLVPTYLRSLPIDPLYDPTVEQYRGYIYYSDGTDYAFIAHGTAEGVWDSTYPFYDSVRPTGSTWPSWKIATPAFSGK